MQKRVAVIVVLALAILACQEPVKKADKNNALAPTKKTSIEFKEKMHNFGQLTAGEIVIFTFEFTNTGNSNFLIDKVICECGCVTVRYPKEVVNPGKKGLIEVEFDTAGLIGKEFKTIEILGNSKELKHLAIFAEVKNEQIEFKY